MTLQEFQDDLRTGIPAQLPPDPIYDPEVNHAPRRKDILTKKRKSSHCATHCGISPPSSTAASPPNSPTS